MTSTSPIAKSGPKMALTEAEARHFALLETAFGDTLWEVLRAYIRGGNDACQALQETTACAHWQEAARQGLKIASLATDLDFRAVVQAARALSDAVYADHTAHARRNAAQMLIMEFERSTLLLESRYPGLRASNRASVA